MKKPSRGLIGYIVLIAAFILMAVLLSGGKSTGGEITYPDLLKKVQDGKVEYVAVRGQNLYGLYYDSVRSYAEFPDSYDFYCVIGSDFLDTLRTMAAADAGVDRAMISEGNLVFSGKSLDIIYLAPLTTPWILEWLPFILMIGLMLFFWWFLMRQQMGGNGKVMNFGRSRAQMSDPSKNKIRFADVAGAVEEKEELKELVDFLRNPRTYLALGARIPKGVLLVGPPGTGKTLLAKAVAGEADVPFFSISGSDFVEMFVGVGASRVRDLFEQAKRNSPSIVFIDEIDAVGRHRGAGLGGGHDEREQTLNQLLVEMDGFAANQGVVVLAATNRVDILDPALLRPGRFDRQVYVGLPDIKGRQEILAVHAKNKPLAEDVDLEKLAKGTSGFTGADLENLLNEAALLAGRRDEKAITMADLQQSVIKVIAGPEKHSRVIPEHERRLTAYHEAGHAVVMHTLPDLDPVHQITIVPRGQAGGMTIFLPDEDRSYLSRTHLLNSIAGLLGGRAAEQLVLGDISTGASNDISRATQLARKMVGTYGMSDRMGSVAFDAGHDEVFIGRSMAQTRPYSEETAAEMDREIRRILDEAYGRCTEILEKYRPQLTEVAEFLLQHETMTAQEFEQIFASKDKQ